MLSLLTRRSILRVDENTSYVPPTIESKEDKSTHTSSVDARSFTEWRCATKKELRLRKAIKEFGKSKSLESVGKALMRSLALI